MLDFLKEYIKHPRTVGAVAPSGKGLSRKMMEPLDFEHAKVIVEYGPGTGSFTELLFMKKKPETRLILIEQNDTFFEQMRERFDGHAHTTVLHGSAEQADTLCAYLGIKSADYVVSGLPFTSLPADTSYRIFKATRHLIGRKGRFVTFQYSKVKKPFFERYFDFADILFELRNLPPAYVFVMKNRFKEKRENT